MKILTIGGATQDLFAHYSGSDVMTLTHKNQIQQFMLFLSGEKAELDSLTALTGGGATNSAVSFKRLGFEAHCFCNIGNDSGGQFVLSELKKERVDTCHIHISSHHSTGTSVIINTAGKQRTVLVYRGANNHLELNKLPYDQIKQSNQLYITSLSSASSQILPDIVAFARQHKVPVAINPGTSQLAKGTLTLKKSLVYIDILILNSYEAHTFMIALVGTDENYKKRLECSSNQKPCALNEAVESPYLVDSPLAYADSFFSIRNFFKAALAMGPKIVVITNGANGVYVATDKTMYFHPSLKVNVVSAVGAGDAFGSCFVASLLQGSTIQDALKKWHH